MAIIDPTKRKQADQADILISFVERLREIPRLNEQTCIVSDQPVPSRIPGGGFVITVSPGGGAFPSEFWEGGHYQTATEDGSVVVTTFLKNRTERSGRSENWLLGRRKRSASTRSRWSLVDWKREILKTLAIDSDGRPWEPVIGDKPLLRDLPIPVRTTGPLDVPEHPGYASLQITYSASWDWELSS